jgi:hypothetical protein
MTLIPLRIQPGLVTEATDRGAQNRYVDADKVRFRKGWPEKLGGWREQTDGDRFEGVPRAVITWSAIDERRYFGVGTSEKLYLRQGSTNADITPYEEATSAFGGGASTLTDPFTTSSGSDIVEVADTSHGRTVNSWVEFANANNVGGLDPNGEWQVVNVIDSDNYEIQHSNAATSNDTGGGTVDFAYQITAGQADAQPGFGYGAGVYGASTWGTVRSGFVTLSPRLWSLDTWGEDLIANPRGGKIYRWQPSSGTSTRASEITAAPDECLLTLVSEVDRHLIAIGCTPIGGSSLDPLVIRWCDQNNLSQWSPAVDNTAGQRRLDDGSRMIAAIRGRREHVLFTDTAVYTMAFTGPPAIFAIRRVGNHGGVVGQMAVSEYNGVVYWMGGEDFFVYDGRIRVLDCPVRNTVFGDINYAQRRKFFAGLNSLFTEVWWFYCSENSTEIDRYVIFNFNEGTWTFGTLHRTAWVDRSEVAPVPYATTRNGALYSHETGSSDDGADMTWFLETYDLELPAGEEDPAGGPGGRLFRVRRLIPDYFERDENITVTLKARKYPNPNGTQVSQSAIMAPDDDYVRPKLRGRQIGIRLDGSSQKPWRSGHWRADIIPHGRR